MKSDWNRMVTKNHDQISIYRAFAVISMLALLAMLGMAFFISYQFALQRAETQMADKANDTLSALVEVLKIPLWDFNDKNVQLIGKIYSQDDFIAKLTIASNQGVVFESTSPAGTPVLLTRERVIEYHDTVVGSVRFAVSTAYREELTRQSFRSFIEAAAILILAVLAFVLVAMHLFIRNPIRYFAGMVANYSEGQPEVFSKGSRYAEFQPLFDLLDRMSRTITSQIQTLKDTNQILDRRVTERTRELTLERNFIQAVVDTQDALVIVLDRNGRITNFNRACEDLTGFTREDLMGQPIWEHLIPPEVRESVQQVFSNLVEGRFPNSHENEWLTRDGERRTIAWRNNVLLDEHHTVEFVVATGIDITQRLKAEQEMAAIQAKMAAQEKMATVGQITATVSHELRNPLGVIRNGIYNLKNFLANADERVHRNLERLERGVLRCDNIIKDLLDFSRNTQSQPVPTDFDAWLREVLEEQMKPKWVRLHISGGLNGQIIHLDHDRIRRVFINLYENAVQAMQEVWEGDPTRKFDITVHTRHGEDAIEILFADTGPGIPGELIEKVFDPLFSTKVYGVGLGLPTVRNIMEQEGGGIRISSTPGLGTSVRLWLPLRKAMPLAAG